MPGSSPLVLALDLSTKVGWACGRAGGEPDHGVLLLPKGVAGLGAVACAFLDGLMDLHEVQHFERVVMEAPLPPQAQTHAHTARLQLYLAGAVETWCYRRSIECREAAAPTVRKAVLGSGRAKKPEVIAWCQAQGWNPTDDNAADALALWRYATTRRGLAVAA